MQLAIDFVVETTSRYLANQFKHPDGHNQERVVIAVASQSESVAAFFAKLAAQLPSYGLEGTPIGDECLRIGPVVVVRYTSPIAHRGDTSIGAIVEDCLVLNEEWQKTIGACQLSAKRFFKFETATVQTSLREV